jgi:MFS family permease
MGKIADKYSFATSMTLCFSVVAVGFLSMVFTTPETRWLYLAYACLHAFAMSGINSGVINLIYDYVVPEDRATAMGVKNALGGILGFLAALLSGFILGKIQTAGGLTVFGATLYAQQFLAFLSFAVTIILIIYMRTVIAPLKRVDDALPEWAEK